MSIAVDASNTFYIATTSFPARLYRLDPTTGDAALVGTNLGVNYIHGGDFLPSSDATDLEVEVTVNNVAPSNLVLSSGTIDENGTFTLSGTFADPGTQDTHAVTINWGDGSALQTVNLAAGVLSFSVTHQYIDDNPTITSSDVYSIGVTVADDDGGTKSGSTSVTVNNVAPVVAIAPSSASAGTQGIAFTVAGSFTDVGTADTHTFAWTATRGGVPVDLTGVAGTSGIGTPGAPLSLTYTPTEPGTYVFKLTVTDDDSGTHYATQTVAVVIGVGAVQSGGRLIVYGTSGNDDIKVIPGSGASEIKVTLNGAQQPFLDVTEIVVYANAGNDFVQIAGGVTAPATVFGGAGNDRIKAGGGNSILIGGAGDDVLLGGAGRDILLGGAGADLLGGNGEDDILVAGTTHFDSSLAALVLIQSEWTSSRSFADRVTNLTGETTTGVNGAALLNEDTVSDDNVVDRLTGNTGSDWFVFDSSNGTNADVVTDWSAFDGLFDADMM